MTQFLPLLMLFTCISIQAQNITGVLKDEDTKQAIAYATVLIPELKVSTLSKSDGSFMLHPKDDKDYVVRIESFGYHSIEVKLSEIKKASEVFLQEAPELMPEMFIPPKNAKIKYYNYGRTFEGSSMMVGSIQSYGRHDFDKGLKFGVMMKNKGFSQLESFHLHINKCTYKNVYYRLQIYEVKNGLPSEKINHQEILFTITAGQHGWIKLNLDNHNVFLGENIKRFAAVLELVHIDFSDDFSSDHSNELNFNSGIATNNMMVAKDSYYEGWMKMPVIIPMYFRAKCYK